MRPGCWIRHVVGADEVRLRQLVVARLIDDVPVVDDAPRRRVSERRRRPRVVRPGRIAPRRERERPPRLRDPPPTRCVESKWTTACTGVFAHSGPGATIDGRAAGRDGHARGRGSGQCRWTRPGVAACSMTAQCWPRSYATARITSLTPDEYRISRRRAGGSRRDLRRAEHEPVLERVVVGHPGDLGTGEPRHRPIEVLERLLGDDRRDLRAEAAGPLSSWA